MSIRQDVAKELALQATKLASQALALSERAKWHEVRKEKLLSTLDELDVLCADMFKMDTSRLFELGNEELFDALDDVTDVAPVKVLSAVVYVPVDCSTGVNGFVEWFDINGFIGGMQSNGKERPNDKRAIPLYAIKSAANNGVVGVDREWLYRPENKDLLAHVAKFPASVTKL